MIKTIVLTYCTLLLLRQKRSLALVPRIGAMEPPVRCHIGASGTWAESNNDWSVLEAVELGLNWVWSSREISEEQWQL